MSLNSFSPFTVPLTEPLSSDNPAAAAVIRRIGRGGIKALIPLLVLERDYS
jgi:hypothetical protein